MGNDSNSIHGEILAIKNSVAADAYALAIEGTFADLTVRICESAEEALAALRMAPTRCLVFDCSLWCPDLDLRLRQRDEAETALGLTGSAPQFCRIPPQTLRVRGQPMPFDVFIRLSEEKYVKVLHEGDPLGSCSGDHG